MLTEPPSILPAIHPASTRCYTDGLAGIQLTIDVSDMCIYQLADMKRAYDSCTAAGIIGDMHIITDIGIDTSVLMILAPVVVVLIHVVSVGRAGESRHSVGRAIRSWSPAIATVDAWLPLWAPAARRGEWGAFAVILGISATIPHWRTRIAVLGWYTIESLRHGTNPQYRQYQSYGNPEENPDEP